MILRRSLKFKLSSIFSLIFFPIQAFATENKIAFSVGASSLNITNLQTRYIQSTTSGLYQVEYQRNFAHHFEMGLGYTLMISQMITGDLGYGIDGAFYYYPVSGASQNTWIHSGRCTLTTQERIRPFIALSVNQRSFTTTPNNFIGLSGMVGSEMSITQLSHLRLILRYLVMSTSSISVNSAELLIGYGIHF